MIRIANRVLWAINACLAGAFGWASLALFARPAAIDLPDPDPPAMRRASTPPVADFSALRGGRQDGPRDAPAALFDCLGGCLIEGQPESEVAFLRLATGEHVNAYRGVPLPELGGLTLARLTADGAVFVDARGEFTVARAAP